MTNDILCLQREPGSSAPFTDWMIHAWSRAADGFAPGVSLDPALPNTGPPWQVGKTQFHSWG